MLSIHLPEAFLLTDRLARLDCKTYSAVSDRLRTACKPALRQAKAAAATPPHTHTPPTHSPFPAARGDQVKSSRDTWDVWSVYGMPCVDADPSDGRRHSCDMQWLLCLTRVPVYCKIQVLAH